MTNLDWILLTTTLLFIIVYGVYKNHKDKDIDGYLLGNQSLPWYHVGLSVMATQASAITFLSTTGQGFDDGMRFVQFYFGLPLAMIVLCVTSKNVSMEKYEFSQHSCFLFNEDFQREFQSTPLRLSFQRFLVGISSGRISSWVAWY